MFDTVTSTNPLNRERLWMPLLVLPQLLDGGNSPDSAKKPGANHLACTRKRRIMAMMMLVLYPWRELGAGRTFRAFP
jgi:hypothetical protein